MANLSSCRPAAAASQYHNPYHLTLPPVRRSLFPKQQRRGRPQRGGGIIAVYGLLFARGHGGDGRASEWELHAAAARAASIRFKESQRPDPLFIDLYAGCLLSTGIAVEDGINKEPPCRYTLATKFIDDKLLTLVSGADGEVIVRQIVLLTDGFDTRPYRLKWPPGTFLFDVSPECVFKVALGRLQSVGAEIAKTCKYVHVPLESYDLQAALCNQGFDGSRPSLWAIQGLPMMTLEDFREILSVVSNLATKGCIFVGELPGWLVDTGKGSQTTVQKWMNKVFNGFRVEIVSCNEVAKNVHVSFPAGDHDDVLFVSEQLQFSEKQMENWRMEFLRMEEEGDEEGFEDLL